jgi:hypothetical protein
LLPPPPGADSKIELLQIIRHYSTLVSYHINAQQNLKVFNQKIKKHYESFKDAILASRPKLVCSKSTSLPTSPITTSFWKRTSTPTDSPPKQSFSSNSPCSFTMEELKGIVSGQKGKELDGHAPYGAFEQLVKKSQTEWKSLVSILLGNVAAELDNLTGKLMQEVFDRFPNLRVHIRNLVHVLQTDLQRNTSEMVGHSIIMESRHPFTLSSTAFVNGKQRELDELQQTFFSDHSAKSSTDKADALKRAMSALGEAGVKGITIQTLLSRLSPQTTEYYLLDLVASSKSYFEISASRFIDTVCLQIDYHFLLAFSEFLEKEMIEGLGVLDKSKDVEFSLFLVEDGTVLNKRNLLLKRRVKLEVIWQRLQIFGTD